MSLSDHDHVTDWVPAYVLGALSEEEAQLVRAHVATCAACQSELEQYQRVVDELPLAAAQVAPPITVKRKLMQVIHLRQTAQRDSQAAGFSAPRYFKRLGASFTSHLPAVGFAIIVLLVLGNLVLWRQLNQASQQTSASVRVVKLENTQYSQGALGTLIMDPEGRYGTLVVSNLATLSTDKQYQVWLIKGKIRTNGGVFSVNSDGYASHEIHVPDPLVAYDAIGVSIEPAGGSPAPTGVNVFHAVLIK